MKLTKQTDFALRTLMYVARSEPGETNASEQLAIMETNAPRRVLAQDVANAYDIPLNHLTKIVHKLSKLGYLKTYRGRNGGIELGKPKEEILIRQVIEDFEPSLNPADCDNCAINQGCGLKSHLASASQAFLTELGNKHLGDVI